MWVISLLLFIFILIVIVIIYITYPYPLLYSSLLSYYSFYQCLPSIIGGVNLLAPFTNKPVHPHSICHYIYYINIYIIFIFMFLIYLMFCSLMYLCNFLYWIYKICIVLCNKMLFFSYNFICVSVYMLLLFPAELQIFMWIYILQYATA